MQSENMHRLGNLPDSADSRAMGVQCHLNAVNRAHASGRRDE